MFGHPLLMRSVHTTLGAKLRAWFVGLSQTLFSPCQNLFLMHSYVTQACDMPLHAAATISLLL